MDRRVQTIIDATQNALSPKADILKLAQERNMSASRLRHVFKAEMGLSLGRYLKFARLHEAETLFRTTYLSTKEVMHRVGFSNRTHFSREFRKAHGLAPGKYRKNCGQRPAEKGNSRTPENNIPHALNVPMESESTRAAGAAVAGGHHGSPFRME